MTVPEPTVKAVRYRVSCVPEDFPDADLFTLSVDYREQGQWAVTNGSRNYAEDGTISFGHGWNKEPVTDEEIDAYHRSREAWLAVHRFDEDTALRIAREQAPLMRYRDYTVQAAIDRAKEQIDADA